MVALNTRFYRHRILVAGCQYINKQCQDFRYYEGRSFRSHLISYWSKSMTKILPCRSRQCFGAFNMLTVYECSDTGIFTHLSSLDFLRTIISQTSNIWESSFFSKYSKCCVDFGNAKKNSENIFRFWDNCIWIRCVNYSLLLRENICHRVSIC